MGRAGPGFIQVLGEVLIEEGEGFGEGDQYAREAGGGNNAERHELTDNAALRYRSGKDRD